MFMEIYINKHVKFLLISFFKGVNKKNFIYYIKNVIARYPSFFGFMCHLLIAVDDKSILYIFLTCIRGRKRKKGI